MEFPSFCFEDSSQEQELQQKQKRNTLFHHNIKQEDQGFYLNDEYQYNNKYYNSLTETENYDDFSTLSQSPIKKEDDIEQEQEDEKEENENKVVYIKKEFGYTSYNLHKAVKSRDFYHLCFDFFFLTDLFEETNDEEEYVFFDYMSKLKNIRPTNQYTKYNNFTVFQLQTIETGMEDHTQAILRLQDAQHINAYNIANHLIQLSQTFQQVIQFQKKLKSIYNWDKITDDLNKNYQISFQMAIDHIRNIPDIENRYFGFVIRRICPNTLTEKFCCQMSSDALINLISNNKLQDANQYFLRKCFPNILDLRSLQEILYKFSLDDISLDSVITCLDGEQIPCKLYLSRQNLSGYEICPGVSLYDNMITFEYIFNPKLIQALEERRKKSNNIIDLYDFRYSAVSEIFKEKFYKI